MWPLAAIEEHLAKEVRPVGYQTVDAHVEELFHLLDPIDGPDMDGHLRALGNIDEWSIDNPYSLRGEGDLKSCDVATSRATQSRPEQPSTCQLRPRRDGDTPFTQLPEERETTIRERPDDEPFPGTQSSYDIDERRFDTVRLEVHDHGHIWEGGEHFLEAWDREVVATEGEVSSVVVFVPRIESSELVMGVRRDMTAPVCGPVHDRVVEAHDHVVGRAVEIGLEVAISQVVGALKRDHRVLGP